MLEAASVGLHMAMAIAVLRIGGIATDLLRC